MLTKEQLNKHAYNLIYSDKIERELYLEFIKTFLNISQLPDNYNEIIQLLIDKVAELGYECKIDKSTMEVYIYDYSFYGFCGFESSDLLEAFVSTLIFMEFARFSDTQDYSNIYLDDAETIKQETELFTKFLIKYINKE